MNVLDATHLCSDREKRAKDGYLMALVGIDGAMPPLSVIHYLLRGMTETVVLRITSLIPELQPSHNPEKLHSWGQLPWGKHKNLLSARPTMQNKGTLEGRSVVLRQWNLKSNF